MLFLAWLWAVSFLTSVSCIRPRYVSYRDAAINQTNLFRQAILVGNAVEAERLTKTLAALDVAPLEVVGYVAPEPCPPDPNGTIPCLGPFRHLRDLVRIRDIQDVVFASRIVPNQTAFDLMQQLKGLPVQFKMLNEQHEHLIGQSSIEALTALALVDAEQAIGISRSTFARRAFEVPLAILGIFLYPIMFLLAKMAGPHTRAGILARKIRQFPDLLIGKKALIGCKSEEHHLLSPSWELREGIFTVSESLPLDTHQEQQLSRAYWLYVRNQSITVDIDIVLRALKQQSK